MNVWFLKHLNHAQNTDFNYEKKKNCDIQNNTFKHLKKQKSYYIDLFTFFIDFFKYTCKILWLSQQPIKCDQSWHFLI